MTRAPPVRRGRKPEGQQARGQSCDGVTCRVAPNDECGSSAWKPLPARGLTTAPTRVRYALPARRRRGPASQRHPDLDAASWTDLPSTPPAAAMKPARSARSGCVSGEVPLDRRDPGLHHRGAARTAGGSPCRAGGPQATCVVEVPPLQTRPKAALGRVGRHCDPLALRRLQQAPLEGYDASRPALECHGNPARSKYITQRAATPLEPHLGGRTASLELRSSISPARYADPISCLESNLSRLTRSFGPCRDDRGLLSRLERTGPTHRQRARVPRFSSLRYFSLTTLPPRSPTRAAICRPH